MMTRRSMPRLAAAAATLVMMAQGVGAASADAVALSPHRAVYEMELLHSEPSSGITGLEGRLVFELIGSPCEGYAVNMRFVSVIEGEDSSMRSDLRTVTWEEGDGSAYRFVSRHYVDDMLAEETDGRANRSPQGMTVQLTSPEEATLRFPAETLFPTEHVRRILAAAQAGQTLLTADVYDGSEAGQTRYATTTFISARDGTAPGEGEVGAEALGGLDSWAVSVAYFDPAAEEPDLPAYEFAYDLYANGVSRRIALDYGDVAIHGDLEALTMLEQAPCP